MDTVLVSLLAFLVTGAIIVIACHVYITLQQLGTRTARSHELTLDEIRIEMPVQADEPAPAPAPQTSPRRHQFRGFHSPPGRF